jgi:hypothetical protein
VRSDISNKALQREKDIKIDAIVEIIERNAIC